MQDESAEDKRRVYYSEEEFYRKVKIASALLGEKITDFTIIALKERIDRKFTQEQQQHFFSVS
jgi:hypothetical protein